MPEVDGLPILYLREGRNLNKNMDRTSDIAEIETKSIGPIPGRKEVLFDGNFYDVTDFIKKHPGGSIIEYYTKSGEDGTHAIQQFHQRSIKRVTAIMSSLKKRPASDSESNYTDKQCVYIPIQ